MIRIRSAAVLAGALLAAMTLAAGQARAAAEVDRLSLVISGIPTQVKTGDFNDALDFYNQTILAPPPRGYEPLPHLGFSWLFDAELRYFVQRNLALDVGVGQIRVAEKKEFLPAISQAIDINAELLTVPVHVGAAYYLPAYNQGDFQARAYLGAGMVQYTYTRATFQQVLTNPDSVTNAQLGGSYKYTLTQDSPGYYLELGAHMFFASRYSVLVSVLYRSGELRNAFDASTGAPAVDPITQRPMKLDVGGIGARMAVGIGL